MMSNGMTTFERRQRILRHLEEQPVVKVTELAVELDVSEGTIRNDLAALESESRLLRVRGGAAAIQQAPPAGARATRSSANVEAKRRIARWAADMVDDGDAIFLDASSTVLHMVSCLQRHQRLSIVTNGLETARLLGETTPHTVILLGGVLGANANAVTGLLGAPMVAGLHLRRAFISGVGLTVVEGLTERDLEEARLKQVILDRGCEVVVLVDSTKLGKVGFAPCLPITQIAHLVTDSRAPTEFIQELRQSDVAVTVCGERTVTTYHRQQPVYRIGFANLTETGIPFAIDVRHGLERAAAERQVGLVLADNRLSGEHALKVADYLIEKEVDLVIEYQIDAAMNSLLMDKFSRAGVPVIAVDIPLVGATFFGIDNYRAGLSAGTAMGKWVAANWAAELSHVIILEEPRAGDLPASRIHGQLDGLQEVLGPIPEAKWLRVDSGNTSEISERGVLQALQNLMDAHHVAILSFNDDAALGALRAAQKLGREDTVAIVGQGADRLVRHEIRQRNSPVIGSTAFMPEAYGEKLIDLALDILEGKPVPPAVFMEPVFIDAANIDDYYADS